jgi:hypothetical protein
MASFLSLKLNSRVLKVGIESYCKVEIKKASLGL